MILTIAGQVILAGFMWTGLTTHIPVNTKVIYTASAGGYAEAGYELGRHLKQHNIALIADECKSACALAALGASSVRGTLCFHHPRDYASGNLEGTEQLKRYLDEMGYRALPMNREYYCIEGHELTKYRANK